jgi:hypothetical protein
MQDIRLEHDGNSAVLKFTTHFGQSMSIPCSKKDSESFRLSFTGANEILSCQGIIKTIYDQILVVNVNGQEIRASRVSNLDFEVGQHIIVTEYYGLYMEGEKSGFIASHHSISDPRILFINVDCLDGGGNLIKRYRVSPYSGAYRCLI